MVLFVRRGWRSREKGEGNNLSLIFGRQFTNHNPRWQPFPAQSNARGIHIVHWSRNALHLH